MTPWFPILQTYSGFRFPFVFVLYGLLYLGVILRKDIFPVSHSSVKLKADLEDKILIFT